MNFHVPCSISYSFKIHPSYLLNTFGENLVGQKLLLFGENDQSAFHFNLTKERLSVAKLKAPKEQSLRLKKYLRLYDVSLRFALLALLRLAIFSEN
jgi:hypothetical protein